jgi:hypothetical protein
MGQEEDISKQKIVLGLVYLNKFNTSFSFYHLYPVSWWKVPNPKR